MGRYDRWCNKCGRKKLQFIHGRPQKGSLWRCEVCGYEFNGTREELDDVPLRGVEVKVDNLKKSVGELEVDLNKKFYGGQNAKN